MDPSVLARKQLTELKGIASHLQMRGYQRLKKAELIEAIVRAASGASEPAGPDVAGNGNGGVAVAERTDSPAADPGASPSRSTGGQLQLDAPSANGTDANAEHPGSRGGAGTTEPPPAPRPETGAGRDGAAEARGSEGEPSGLRQPGAGRDGAAEARGSEVARRETVGREGGDGTDSRAVRGSEGAASRPGGAGARRPDVEARGGGAPGTAEVRGATRPDSAEASARRLAAGAREARRPGGGDGAARLIARGEDRARRIPLGAAPDGDADGDGDGDEGEGATAGRPAGDEGRTRVRTRTRDRSGQGDDPARPDDLPRAEPAVPARNGRPDGDGAPDDAASAADAEARRGQADGDDDGDGDGEEFGGRRRRSRRERRRNKGQNPPGQNGQAQAAPQATRQFREDEAVAPAEPGEVRSGVLDILPEGYGFLRTSGYLPGDRDVYVSQSQVRRHGLRRGDVVEGPIRQQRTNEKVPALHHVDVVNGTVPDPETGAIAPRPDFKDMTPLFPDDRLRLETPDGPTSMRIVDLMSPIGKGQRALIVSPPKAGKTTILKELGQAIAVNNPECHLMVVLVDERPEEVTDMQRSVPGEIIASTFDRPADDHTQIAELAIERAKRLVEQGQDVVILLDSITRLSRAYNLAAPASGRIMSGGVDSTALYPPKRFFGAARNIEHGGSLTIIATALIETGSKMDEVIFEEFKGTGNSEIRLDRKLEQKRVFPAIDIGASGTRKEELLLEREELAVIWKLRRVLHALDGPAALELLIDRMKQTRSNNQFLVMIQKSNLNTAGAHA